MRVLLTISEASEALGVSRRHIERLIAEADANRKSRWRWGRELIDLAPVGASRRTVRVNLGAVVPGHAPPPPPPHGAEYELGTCGHGPGGYAPSTAPQ